jgi:hypothetical protein
MYRLTISIAVAQTLIDSINHAHERADAHADDGDGRRLRDQDVPAAGIDAAE